MHLKSWILLFAVFAVCKAGVLNPTIGSVFTSIMQFSRLLLRGNQRQVGGLFVYEVSNNTPFFTPSPTTDNGMLPISDAAFAPNLSMLNNYLVARPIPRGSVYNPTKKDIHTEAFVVKNHGEEVLEAYKNHTGRNATHAVIYTHLVPCTSCTRHIVNFKEQNERLHISLIYTEDYNKNTDGKNIKTMDNANITVVNMACVPTKTKKKRSAENPECQLESFQGCLLDQLNNVCCFKKHSDKVLFINAFVAECFPDYHKTCSDVLVEARFSACSSSKEKLQDSFHKLIQNCSSKALSNPLQASAPNVFTGILTCANCLQTPPKSCRIKQDSACGHRGNLCTTTAGNSMCRDDHYCGLHGKAFSWCYIDGEDNWDYCCLGSCKMDYKMDAMICYAGQVTDKRTATQESAMYRYCGDAGTQTVKGENCDPSHPCGTHNGTYYYWCYKQSGLGWDYCCRPDQVCGKKGKDFNWCLFGSFTYQIPCNPVREAECHYKSLAEEEPCPCSNACSSQGAAGEWSLVKTVIVVVCIVVAIPLIMVACVLICNRKYIKAKLCHAD